MLQMMPPGIGQILRKMGARGAQEAGTEAMQARQGQFPVTLPEFARMSSTSNDDLLEFRRRKDAAEGVPMQQMMEKRTMMKRAPPGDVAESAYTSDPRGYYNMGRPEWAPTPELRHDIRDVPTTMPRDATAVPGAGAAPAEGPPQMSRMIQEALKQMLRRGGMPGSGVARGAANVMRR